MKSSSKAPAVRLSGDVTSASAESAAPLLKLQPWTTSSATLAGSPPPQASTMVSSPQIFTMHFSETTSSPLPTLSASDPVRPASCPIRFRRRHVTVGQLPPQLVKALTPYALIPLHWVIVESGLEI